jgi:hypothetical protein
MTSEAPDPAAPSRQIAGTHTTLAVMSASDRDGIHGGVQPRPFGGFINRTASTPGYRCGRSFLPCLPHSRRDRKHSR